MQPLAQRGKAVPSRDACYAYLLCNASVNLKLVQPQEPGQCTVSIFARPRVCPSLGLLGWGSIICELFAYRYAASAVQPLWRLSSSSRIGARHHPGRRPATALGALLVLARVSAKLCRLQMCDVQDPVPLAWRREVRSPAQLAQKEGAGSAPDPGGLGQASGDHGEHSGICALAVCDPGLVSDLNCCNSDKAGGKKNVLSSLTHHEASVASPQAPRAHCMTAVSLLPQLSFILFRDFAWAASAPMRAHLVCAPQAHPRPSLPRALPPPPAHYNCGTAA